jgi:hypothetical protein
MKQLHNAQDAIEQAIEGGYEVAGVKTTLKEIHHSTAFFEYGIEAATPILFTDPLFWQALGKARGWIEKQAQSKEEREKASGYHIVEQDVCEKYAIQWFKTRLSNVDEIKFWQNLP